MLKALSIIFVLVVTSFYFFPFVFTFFPVINTKAALAGIGLILLFFQFARKRSLTVDRDFFFISLLALLISFVAFTAVVYNGTKDYAYATYIASMWVWASAAYVVIVLMKQVHGYITVEIVCFYLIAVCALQCLLAITMDMYAPLKDFVDSFLGGEGFMGKNKERLYGIGCALDVAGTRFSVALVMIVFLLSKLLEDNSNRLYIVILLAAFYIIATIGCMIGRTTTIGLIISTLYLLYVLVKGRVWMEKNSRELWQWFIGSLVVVIFVSIWLYTYNVQWRENIRFGFEGFFSLVEKGRWEVHSNEMMKSHYIFPETLKTWIIGDGYIGSTDSDPFYLGKPWRGFYMGTDVGYSRFLFYFGFIGLFVFIAFICKVGQICMKRFVYYRLMFFCILLVNMIVWAKVSSDIFLVFALFLCISKEENKAYNNNII